MEKHLGGSLYVMGPRIPQVRRRDTMGTTTSVLGFKVPSPVVAARAETSTECTDPRLCEKPVGSSSMTLPIALGVALPLAAAIGVLLYLHRRNVKRQRKEDLNDPHKSLDFGLGLNGGTGKSRRKSLLGKEKDSQSRFNRQQMSMDMNLSSPYLLPPEVHNSRESLHSLAKTLQQSEDPYRPVAQYAASEVGSIRSVPRGEAASVYTRRSSRQDLPTLSSPGPYSPSRHNSLPKSPLSPPEPSHLKPEQPLPERSANHSNHPSKGPQTSVEPAISGPQGQQDDSVAAGVSIQEPPAVAQKAAPKSPQSPLQPSPADSGIAMGYSDIGNPFEKPEAQEVETPTESASVGLGLAGHTESARASVRTSASSYSSRPTSPAPQRGLPGPATAPIIEEPLEYYDYDHVDMPRQPRSPSPPHLNGQLDVDEPRGRNMQRTSHLFEQQDGAHGGLGVPQQDSRRLSVGFRPLPPDEIMESEDPEYRANRIRSFYKEYFDESKPEDRPPVPPMPPMPQQRQQQESGTNYYEDYDPSFAQDAPYFDPASNSFVMPYAQPVSRRAMTPPPARQRFPGPRGPPRAFHGSQASMRLPPNVRGPPRPGSSVSNQMGGHSRPGSAASSAYGRSRAGSAMSGGRFGGPKKPVPPPADLTTLPTPSKLKDDSFAIFNAIDFAPPETFAERARGRSQSPVGERRPYRMNVPAHSPLVNAFEELPALPSPHLLRKSGTFTALDFAPPRKFTDSDARSDAGSIRSNRSGISAAQLSAIRSGAGRVSRLPGDQIFTQAALSEKLKPQWGMRD
ncbi:hypothetical protein VTK56DRAFT_7446 [Thermocarpiscus australiensis]